ncbi:hypothetical protein [Mediterraneibacter agrestimuris]|uniref:hypothetical protein n=1 Tax=Mediterraneibacter agrestimuris TaxID=2941333 RepID=UPI00203A4004|nr:hypothetical protein [Mediterraneibacter agrestimuris]
MKLRERLLFILGRSQLMISSAFISATFMQVLFIISEGNRVEKVPKEIFVGILSNSFFGTSVLIITCICVTKDFWNNRTEELILTIFAGVVTSISLFSKNAWGMAIVSDIVFNMIKWLLRKTWQI